LFVQVMALGAGQSPLPVQGIVHSILVIIAKGSHMPAVQLAALVHGSHSPPPPASPPLEPELPLLEPELPLLEPELPLLEPELPPLLEPELPLLEPELDPDPPLLEPDASLCEPPSSSLPPPELLPQATIAMAPIAARTKPDPALLAIVTSRSTRVHCTGLLSRDTLPSIATEA
jgi:hypothetical protein